MKSVIAVVFLLAASAFAQAGYGHSTSHASQSVAAGQVTRSVPLPTGQGNDFTVDFALIQDIGGTPAEGYFGYDAPSAGSQFTLLYFGDWLCTAGCSFDGTFKWWHFPEIKDGHCVTYHARLVGTLTYLGSSTPNSSANYYQEVCANDGSYRFAGGDLSVFLQ